MPRKVLEFRVVVASPSDLFETRPIIFDVVHELNRTFEAQGVSIRGLGWEEYATPGIGAYTQEVINHQLLTEYDILIALFATRLGTQTPNFKSGTIEEIEHAIAKTQSALGEHRVQIYFLDRIDSASSISIEDLGRVAEYRRELQSRGIFYRLFRDNDDLQREVRVNIQKPIMRYLTEHGHQPEAASQASEQATLPQSSIPIGEPTPSIEELGLLDYAESAEEAIQATALSVTRISQLIETIGTEAGEQVSEIEKVSSPSFPTRQKKTTLNAFASVLKSRASELKREASTARTNFAIFTTSAIAAANIERQDGNADRYKEGVISFLKESEAMISGIPASRTAMVGLKMAVVNMPRITIQFNQAKRLLVEALEECLQLFDQTELGIYEIAAKIEL